MVPWLPSGLKCRITAKQRGVTIPEHGSPILVCRLFPQKTCLSNVKNANWQYNIKYAKEKRMLMRWVENGFQEQPIFYVLLSSLTSLFLLFFFLIFKYLGFYLKVRDRSERDREILYILVHSPLGQNPQSWPVLTSSFPPGSSMWGQQPKHWGHPLLLSQDISSELSQKSISWDSNPAPAGNASARGGGLMCYTMMLALFFLLILAPKCICVDKSRTLPQYVGVFTGDFQLVRAHC